MLYINHEEVAKVLTMERCIEIMGDTLKALAQGKAYQPLRVAERLDNNNVFGLMPAVIKSKNIVGSKIITVFPNNHSKGLPSHQGVVTVFDARDGVLKAIVDGISITAIRTAAVSAVATEVLAKKQAGNLAILGAGTQARTHLEAMLLVRDIKRVKVWDYYIDSAQEFAAEMEVKHRIKIEYCQTVEDAVKDADVICTVTLAETPILNAQWLKPGVHINAVGACAPHARELDTETIVKSKFFVDRVESTVNEAGCYLIPLVEGAIQKDHIIGEIGEVLVGGVSGRSNDEEITVFKALGLAVEDLAVANFIFEQAEKLEIGISI